MSSRDPSDEFVVKCAWPALVNILHKKVDFLHVGDKILKVKVRVKVDALVFDGCDFAGFFPPAEVQKFS